MCPENLLEEHCDDGIYCSIDDEALEALACQSLDHLHFSSSSCSVGGFTRFISKNPTLQALSCCCVTFDASDSDGEGDGATEGTSQDWLCLFGALQTCSILSFLSFSRGEATDAMISDLCRLQLLSTLHLRATEVTDTGLISLANSNLPLKGIDVGCCSISDKGIEALCEGKASLRELWCDHVEDITDATLRAATQLHCLESFRCNSTNATELMILMSKPFQSLKTLAFPMLHTPPSMAIDSALWPDFQLMELQSECRVGYDPWGDEAMVAWQNCDSRVTINATGNIWENVVI